MEEVKLVSQEEEKKFVDDNDTLSGKNVFPDNIFKDKSGSSEVIEDKLDTYVSKKT